MHLYVGLLFLFNGQLKSHQIQHFILYVLLQIPMFATCIREYLVFSYGVMEQNSIISPEWLRILRAKTQFENMTWKP